MSEEDYDHSPDFLDDHENGTKPGRKPILTEPKNKRTAQNRAAQRAFRERKERKLKELEDTVDLLESEKIAAVTESEFLKKQVEMLMSELNRYRNDGPEVSPLTPGILGVHAGKTPAPPQEFAFEFPWSLKAQQVAESVSTSSRSDGDKTGSTSISSYSSPDDVADRRSSNTSHLQGAKYKQQEQTFDFNQNFDEQVNGFCGQLNTACGTKENPIPQSCGSQGSGTLSQINENSNSLSLDDPLLASFLNDATSGFPSVSYDTSLNIFDDITGGNDPLANLVSEESAYDPLGMSRFTTQFMSPPVGVLTPPGLPFSNPAQVSTPPTEAVKVEVGTPFESYLDMDHNEIVPSKDDQLMKCSEIWDRITSHPKYTELDIDGLCYELKNKAKCSEKGAVVDHDDVQKILDRAVASAVSAKEEDQGNVW
ncbi:hypothetical protein BABINDRAFT_182994 [Babjeviella inositovora NRRL Y-12698]|uniref:BZIP domain-containing protein n=1 Tax=Babjeviella inositovora NRRL Y-12698 TaxID=984486 RepID=A0A1E3QTP4_9ASCO|nr:uncharacterized protein BABINDRAFT_182994 [Babjeviella inositovora NRRL Y-12698]ODQ81040.1 hypothetical protein BABINDRAFT_182994 [Babjeviella inositovora NRRL Y-12698]